MGVGPHVRLGVDIGGTKIAAIALEADSGRVKFETKFRTPSAYDELLIDLKGMVDGLETELGEPVTYGMCYPGSIPPGESVVHNSNLRWLNGKPFEKDLSTLLARDIRTGNDANCFVLSEALEGAGKGYSVVFGATIGTGLGGGLVVDEKLLVGLNKLAGEWGHNLLPNLSVEEESVDRCYCGRTGCLESFLSGTGLSARYAFYYGEKISAETLIDRASQGDEKSLRMLSLYEDQFARACGMVINLIDPDVIILGGGLSSLGRLYDNIPQQWQRYVFSSMPIRTRLLPAAFGPQSGMRGAAWLWGR